MAASDASDSKTLFLDSLKLAWVMLRSWTFHMCMSSISWLWVGSVITISVLVRNSVIMSWTREIPMWWTTFYHVFRISSAEFFSSYVNMEFPKALDSPEFYLSFMEVAYCPLPAYLPLHLPEILPLPEPPPLPHLPLPLPIAVDCCQLYRPFFLLCQRSLNLRCQWYSLLGLSTVSTMELFGGCPLVSLCL